VRDWLQAGPVKDAVTGASDWADTELSDPAVRRLGVVHAATNAAAQLLYAASLAARLRGKRGRGRLLALLGAGVLGGGGYLGAHMSYVSDLAEGHPRHAEADGTPIMLLRSGGRIYAIDDRCSQRGCLLSDGELEENVVMCSCHGSRFGVRAACGPAIVGQPVFETRDNNGRIEVRQLP
jgi:nitrite reductase/ring-hydroxylating ferredoxin subunit